MRDIDLSTLSAQELQMLAEAAQAACYERQCMAQIVGMPSCKLDKGHEGKHRSEVHIQEWGNPGRPDWDRWVEAEW